MGKKVNLQKNFVSPTEAIWEDNKKLSVFKTARVLTDVV